MTTPTATENRSSPLYDERGRRRSVQELRAERHQLIEQMRGIQAAAEDAQSSEFTVAQQHDWDEAQGQVTKLDGALLLAEAEDERDRRSISGGPDAITDETRVLKPEQRVADWLAVHQGGFRSVQGLDEPLSLGKYLRGMATGIWEGADAERRSLAEGVLASGGYMVPEPLSGTIIDLARNQARVIQAGAQTIPMTEGKLKMARVASDPSASWRAENEPIAESDMTFERVEFVARTLACVVRSSRELLEDVSNVEQTLQNAFSRSIALEIDRAALRGSGSNSEPTGVRNATGVTIQTSGANGAAPTNYDPLVDLIGAVNDENFDATALIWAPRTERTFAKLKDTTNQPLAPPAMVADVKKLATKQIPVNITVGTSTDTSEIYAGDWSELMIGMRTSLEIQILRERYVNSPSDSSPTEGGQIGFLAWLRADVQLAHPKAFAVKTGVRP